MIPRPAAGRGELFETMGYVEAADPEGRDQTIGGSAHEGSVTQSLQWRTNTTLCRTSRTPIRGDGVGRFIATATQCPSVSEAATIRLNEAPIGPERRPFVIS
jgi:hypothetical protein